MKSSTMVHHAMKSFKLAVIAVFMATAIVVSWGSGAVWAGQGQEETVAPPPTEQQQAEAKKRAEKDAAKVRAQRDEMIKRRHDAQQQIKKVVEGEQQPSAAPGNAGKENAK